MKSKVCNKCNKEVSVDKFSYNTVNGKKYQRNSCNSCRATKDKKDGVYYVYYLPEHHYCGVTGCLVRRMIDHRKHGRNTENWRVLYASKSKKDAAIHEALFHSWLGMEGITITF